jgi:hypothetical protein
MTDEQINIKIAELCGLFRIAPLKRTTRKGNDDPNGVVLWYCSEDHGGAKTYDRLPNYTADLNACHEFEETLDYGQAELYDDELCDICAETNELLDNPKPWRFAVTTATARQRCEAFLRVHVQWEDKNGR